MSRSKTAREKAAVAEAKLARLAVEKPRPPDPEEMNDERAELADMAVNIFRQTTGTEAEDALPDLLADLMHWADRQTTDVCIDFDHALATAREHYAAETSDE